MKRGSSTFRSPRSSSRLWALLALLFAFAPVLSAGAQEMPLAVVDQERLFEQSAFGQRIFEEIDRRTAELAAENHEIERRLTAEERDLTDRRDGMEAEAFRAEAQAFDAKVQRLRAEQDAKARDINRMQERARQEFYSRAAPILGELLSERGAAVLLDQRAVLSAVADVDITDAAIARIDAEIGDGTEDE